MSYPTYQTNEHESELSHVGIRHGEETSEKRVDSGNARRDDHR